MRCPIFCLSWTPEGRRLITGPKFGHSDLRPCFTFSVPEVIVTSSHSGASSGEFTLWNGLTFNFETILQAHDSPVDKQYPPLFHRQTIWNYYQRCGRCSGRTTTCGWWPGTTLATSSTGRATWTTWRCSRWAWWSPCWQEITDKGGLDPSQQNICWKQPFVQAHKEAIRRVSFCPTDAKFASCSDDGTVSLSLSIYVPGKVSDSHFDLRCEFGTSSAVMRRRCYEGMVQTWSKKCRSSLLWFISQSCILPCDHS